MRRKNRFLYLDRHKILVGILCLLVLCVWAQHRPNPPKIKHLAKTSVKDDPQKKVYLEFAETLDFDEKLNPDYQILRGNVVKKACICFVIVPIFMRQVIL